MSARALGIFVAVALLALLLMAGLAACGDQQQTTVESTDGTQQAAVGGEAAPDESDQAVDSREAAPTEPGTGSESTDQSGAEGDQGAAMDVGQPPADDAGSAVDSGSAAADSSEGSGSGAAEPLLGAGPPEAEAELIAAQLREVSQGVPFALIEPSNLPEGTRLDAVSLLPPDSEDDPERPEVVLKYRLGSGGTLVVNQHPTAGIVASGQEVDIAGKTGLIVLEDPPVVVWEQDGIEIEFRGRGIDLETVLAAARSAVPLTVE